MVRKGAGHTEQIPYLKKIEGQIRGIQKMIQDNRYCIDILVQLHSIVGAILSVEDKILKKHLQHCFIDALKGKSEAQKDAKLKEVIDVLSQFRRTR
ncbi:metal-sensitive transcriptional regulator [Candidatus Omnitrophota bacterium]